ncbi:putative cytoplasmic protein [Desulfocurvibacter africanus subsp. africanus str. Walvis Bay]|uniref:Putative cytoplasmic protein n=2 Tax=Desulfocurvibacter africanus TaxID=873 RepID=F3YYQ3_DESAF|nr:hypothetical protein [Desulfocurvibacter africanus]EGJ51879.1 putative cytoplasmic protein [Desulfocurvibacter africanus subsp. africanus str. Walvis Bay]
MDWTVKVAKKAEKGLRKLPLLVRRSLAALMLEIEKEGPVRGNWPNYSKLGPEKHHCHLKKGNPTYVAVWEERDRQVRLVEVTYAGTHEKAPY